MPHIHVAFQLRPARSESAASSSARKPAAKARECSSPFRAASLAWATRRSTCTNSVCGGIQRAALRQSRSRAARPATAAMSTQWSSACRAAPAFGGTGSAAADEAFGRRFRPARLATRNNAGRAFPTGGEGGKTTSSGEPAEAVHGSAAQNAGKPVAVSQRDARMPHRREHRFGITSSDFADQTANFGSRATMSPVRRHPFTDHPLTQSESARDMSGRDQASFRS